MAKCEDMMLRQVKLTRRTPRGTVASIVWLPKPLAIFGGRIQDENQVVWFIEAVYAGRQRAKEGEPLPQWKPYSLKSGGSNARSEEE